MDANELYDIAKSITNSDKLDKVYEKFLLPRMISLAKNKLTKMEIRDNLSLPIKRDIDAIMGKQITLQRLIETEMKPYLEDKGFNVITFQPSYLVEIRWNKKKS